MFLITPRAGARVGTTRVFPSRVAAYAGYTASSPEELAASIAKRWRTSVDNVILLDNPDTVTIDDVHERMADELGFTTQAIRDETERNARTEHWDYRYITEQQCQWLIDRAKTDSELVLLVAAHKELAALKAANEEWNARGEHITARRREVILKFDQRGVSRTSLAKMAGVSKSLVTRICNGER